MYLDGILQSAPPSIFQCQANKPKLKEHPKPLQDEHNPRANEQTSKPKKTPHQKTPC
jgi:hypothetical protein